MLLSLEYDKVDGMGRVLDARRTAYWRSQSRRTISGVDDELIPARRTWEEPKDSIEISLGL